MDVQHLALQAWVAYEAAKVRTWERLVTDESGEGVISAAIAVLVMSFIGVGMWVAFRLIFDTADEKVTDNVNRIGR
jgi:hypothetical protein